MNKTIVDQWTKTTQRYMDRTPERAGTEARIAAGAVLSADTPERVGQRLLRKGLDPDTVAGLVSGALPLATAEADSPRVLQTLERIIGKDDLIGAGFLMEGARVCRAVCRVEMCEPNGLVGGYGTGVMISSRLLLTNNHVLDSVETAAASQAEFGYEEDNGGRLLPSVRFALEPGTLFVTDPELDFTVVAVSPDSVDGQTVRDFGSVPLIELQGKAIKGESVNIIQHPNGEPKRLALRENTIVDLLENFLHYKTDTAPGSSGSPVFNDEWEMVALHHSGVPAKDGDGNVLAIDGGVWSPEMGEHRVRWVANEGVRVSRIIACLREHALPEAQQELLREAMVEGDATGQAALSREIPLPQTPIAASGQAEAVTAAPPLVDEEVMIWTIPIQVSARLGAPFVISPQSVNGHTAAGLPHTAPTPITNGADRERPLATVTTFRRSRG